MGRTTIHSISKRGLGYHEKLHQIMFSSHPVKIIRPLVLFHAALLLHVPRTLVDGRCYSSKCTINRERSVLTRRLELIHHFIALAYMKEEKRTLRSGIAERLVVAPQCLPKISPFWMLMQFLMVPHDYWANYSWRVVIFFLDFPALRISQFALQFSVGVTVIGVNSRFF